MIVPKLNSSIKFLMVIYYQLYFNIQHHLCKKKNAKENGKTIRRKTIENYIRERAKLGNEKWD